MGVLPSGIKAGDTVIAGDTLGTILPSPPAEAVLASHLHFELLCNGKNENPAEYIKYKVLVAIRQKNNTKCYYIWYTATGCSSIPDIVPLSGGIPDQVRDDMTGGCFSPNAAVKTAALGE